MEAYELEGSPSNHRRAISSSSSPPAVRTRKPLLPYDEYEMPSRPTSSKGRGAGAGASCKGLGRRSKHEPERISVEKGVPSGSGSGSGSRQPLEHVLEGTPRRKTGKKNGKTGKRVEEISTDDQEGRPVVHTSKSKTKATARGKRQSKSKSKSIDDLPSSPLAARTPLRPLEPFPLPPLSVNDLLRRSENDITPRPTHPLGLKTGRPALHQSGARDVSLSTDDAPTIKKLSRPEVHKPVDLAEQYTRTSAPAGPSKARQRPNHLDDTSCNSPDPLALDDTSSDSEFVYGNPSKLVQKSSRVVPPPTPSPAPTSSSKSTSRRTLVPCSSSPSTSSRSAKVQPFPLPPPARTALVDDIIGSGDTKGSKRHREEILPDNGMMPRSPLADLSPKKQRTKRSEVARGPQPKRRELGRTSSSDFAEMEISEPRSGGSRDEEDAARVKTENMEAKRVRPRREKTKTEGDLFFEQLAKQKPSSPIGAATKRHSHFQSESGVAKAPARRDSLTEMRDPAALVLDISENAGVLEDLWEGNDATPRARAAKEDAPSEAVMQLRGMRSDFENELAADWDGGGSGEDDEDDEIDLSLYVDPDDLCPFCSEPMPMTVSPELMSLEIELRKISKPCPTSDNPNARKINWQKSIDFCSLHDAQAKVIPRGIKVGYPASIDFPAILVRLETRWIRNALGSIAKYPHRYSTLFHAVERDIGRIGKRNWSAAGHQSNREVMTATDVGYYGSLGKEIITRHMQHLLSWGYFPTLRPSDPGEVRSCEPLSAHDFVSHIIVPEASILLIMEDLGWRGVHKLGSDEWTEARNRAVTVWRKSREYGRGRFGEGMEGGRAVLKEVQKRLEGMKDEIDEERRGDEVRKKKRLDKKKKKTGEAWGEAREPIIISDDESERNHELGSVGHAASSQASSAPDASSDTDTENVRCLRSASRPRDGATPHVVTGRSTRKSDWKSKSKSKSASPSCSGKAGRELELELEPASSFDDVESFGQSDVDEIYARMDQEPVRAGKAR